MVSKTWKAAMTRFELSFAYPFISIALAIMMLSSVGFRSETLGTHKGIGTLMARLIVIARS